MIELNRIYNEPCEETMRRLPDGCIDLTVTSPPYDGLRDYNGFAFDIDTVVPELYRVTKPGGVVVWVVGDQTNNGTESGTSFRQALRFMEGGFNLHDTMIYSKHSPPLTHNRYEQHFEFMFVFSKGKPNVFNPIMEQKKWTDDRQYKPIRREKDGSFDMGRASKNPLKIKGNIWHYHTGGFWSAADKIAFQHPAIFPEQLAHDHIKSWSNKGDLVYDPFMGSGTTAKMALVLERKYIGSEISAEYCEIARKRLNKLLVA